MNDDDHSDYYSRKQARADAVLPYLVRLAQILLVLILVQAVVRTLV
jgi:hypothetical protein